MVTGESKLGHQCRFESCPDSKVFTIKIRYQNDNINVTNNIYYEKLN